MSQNRPRVSQSSQQAKKHELNTDKNHNIQTPGLRVVRFATRSRMNGPPKLFASRALIG